MLAAWRDSPTRLREDAATEADLVRAGYRDRLLTELAQNAADAAAKAAVPGRLAVWLEDTELHIANTGVPLDISGVHALTALRVSAKPGAGSTVGRFGVGFTAVLAAGDEIEFRSTTGSLRFSLAETRNELRHHDIRLPDDGTDFRPPVLRLAWPAAAAPAAGFDSEVVLRLRADVDAEALLASMRAEATDLLLELPALRDIRIGPDEFAAALTDLGDGLQELRITGPDDQHTWWQYATGRARWLLPVHAGRPRPVAPDVLRAPTRSDEELSVPALLIADIAMQPDRRRLLPGARIAELAAGYADFARALPPRDRLVLVPTPGFARSETDAGLREALLAELRSASWLPVVEQDGRSTAAPQRASVFPGVTAELAELLADVVGSLVVPELSGGTLSDALAALDVHRIGLARIAELSIGLERPPQWWYSLYDAVEPFVSDPLAVEELGALAVPLADGRLVTGPRTVVLDDRLAVPIPVRWARLVHPEAAHELLGRLGARLVTAGDLLDDPALRAELEHEPGDPDTVDAVLGLAAQLTSSADPAALPSWLGLLELPDDTGAALPADELLLPGAPLAAVLVPDSPFGTVDSAFAERHGAATLRAVGVGWGFTVVSESDPTGPDHQLDDEEAWWDGLVEDPPELAAVRDLDLVDEARWPDALRLLLSEPATRRLLADRDGYTAWWLRRHARVEGRPLGLFRAPDDPIFAALLPELAGFAPADIDALRGVLADSRTITTELATALLDALADPAKTPAPEAISQVHRRLAAVVDRLDLDELGLPERVRALSGAVIDPADALVLDEPWYGLAVPPDRLVAGDIETAPALATLLDLPLVSEAVSAEVLGDGVVSSWADEPLGVVLRLQFGLPTPAGPLVLHDRLRVRLTGACEATVAVPWWRADDVTHVQRPPR
ncbi:sacsin N-terminal ATP-binding-like domain-containing protein [Nocardia blacklockiae]|uniref:sacsin N-terminal ATP-binding-like domain-containing protein n=1 Tax=Nocardia blacklockiae TaxID=480036 RepID=UPI00189315C0|nr:ATP-binding protein [Nocardia blacklockiae]MBF6171651.1 ATP-binding protein [Nocardia blacklockiae]